MDAVLEYAHAAQEKTIGLIRTLVECESPSDDPLLLDQFVALICDVVAPVARTKVYRNGSVLIDFDLPGGRKKGRILAIGHCDTVWPKGTLQSMPFRQADGRLWGPGVLDMKAGVALFIQAMRALRDLEIPVGAKVSLLLTPDEETGSESSRAQIESLASKSRAVLVLEPGTGPTGKLKTSRKGVGRYLVRVRGRAAHSGIDFAAGASAVVELAHQIGQIAALSDLERGITVNPGVVAGGTRSNVVAEHASVEVDVRVPRLKDAEAIDRKLRRLKPRDRRCAIEVTGALNRPPMERTPAIANLFALARDAAAGLGLKLEESSTGGGSDGNFTAALGIPTLDGLGAVGEGAHASHESIFADRIADRTALLARLVEAVSRT
jgi:glutamate carboxypeptidase